MADELQILGTGAALAVDMALLLSVLERRNRRHVALPVQLLVVSVGMLHGGEFSNLLLVEAAGGWADASRWLAMTAMAAGLLLMPSAMFHCAMRMWRTGFQVPAPGWWGYLLAYLPLGMLPEAAWLLGTHRGEPFLTRVQPLVGTYTVLVCVANVTAVAVFLRGARKTGDVERRFFLIRMSAVLAALTALLAGAVWIGHIDRSDARALLVVAVLLSPLAPTLLFAYYILRYRFLQLVMTRTFLYAIVLAAAVLVHQLLVQPYTHHLHLQYGIHVGVVEGMLLLLAFLVYRPVGGRARESLQYLFARGVGDIRERTRRVAVAMWQHLDDEPQQLIDWFVAAVRESFEVSRAAGWLFDASGRAFVRSGDGECFPEVEAAALHRALPAHSFVAASEGGIVDGAAVDGLRQLGASLAVRVDHAGFSGLLVLGRRSRAREFGEEETNAVLLLAELLGATLHSHHQQTQRRDAERIAAQHEKLSTVGMLTSCLTHEIKNPLSSIRTIATVLAQQFGESHPQHEDVRLILQEVERLSSITGQFLRFARPGSPAVGTSQIPPVIDGAVRVLSSLLRGKGVAVSTNYEPDLPPVAADENTLREIFFNLLLNSAEAAVSEGGGGQVDIVVRRKGAFVETLVSDNGSGIAPEIQGRIFTPFVTNKPAGTGLGLYMVRRHVEHLGGEISLDSRPGQATCFCVKLPIGGSGPS